MEEAERGVHLSESAQNGPRAGSPLDEPINVNSGIGNIGNMGKNPNLPNSKTWILT